MARIPFNQAGMQSSLTASTSQSGHSSTKKKGKGRALMPPPSSPPSEPATTLSSSKKTSSTNVIWDERRTDLLVQWILSHSADQHILFHDRTSSTTPKHSPDDKPSGKNKKDVSAVIAKHIFENDPNYSTLYRAEPAKFVTSVINRLNTLKAKYREHRSRFRSTGSGIAPRVDGDAGSQPQNLLEEVLRVFPHYQELDSIWNGIPSFDSELISPKSANHSQSLSKIIRRKQPIEVPDEQDGGKDVEAEMDKMDEDEIVFIEKEPTGDQGPLASSSMHLEGPDADNLDSGIRDLLVDAPMLAEDEHEVDQEFDVAHTPPPKSKTFTPFSLSPKGKTPSREGRSTFSKPTPYARPPNSVGSMSGSRSRPASVTSRVPSGSSARNSLTAKIEELERRSEALVDHDGSPGGQDPASGSSVPISGSSRSAMQYNFAIRKQELDIQHEALLKADAKIKSEQELMKLEIQLREQEECNYVRQIEVLQLQYALQMSQGTQMQTGQSLPRPSESAATTIGSPFVAGGSLPTSSPFATVSSFPAGPSFQTGALPTSLFRPSGSVPTGPPWTTTGSAPFGTGSSSFSSDPSHPSCT